MHVDTMLVEWTEFLWKKFGIDGIITLVVLFALYFIVKWAVKSGVKEAIREMQQRKEIENLNLSLQNQSHRVRYSKFQELIFNGSVYNRSNSQWHIVK